MAYVTTPNVKTAEAILRPPIFVHTELCEFWRTGDWRTSSPI